MSIYNLTEKQFRLLAFLPLAFFFAQATHYWQIKQIGHMLWMCNIGNLVLALGIFFGLKTLIRVAAIWSIPGVVVWLIYVVPTWGMLLAGKMTGSEIYGVVSSTLAHLGSISVSVIVLRKVKMVGDAWIYSFLWYLVIQFASRVLTPYDLNVNVAQKIPDGWETTFSSYWKFWLLLSVLVGIGLWLLELLLKMLWPANKKATAA